MHMHIRNISWDTLFSLHKQGRTFGVSSSDVIHFADSPQEDTPYLKNEWEIAREGKWVSGVMGGGGNWDWYEK